MDPIHFFILVDKMRKAQKAYFKSRLQRDLIESKELEKKVDQALQEGLGVAVETKDAEQGTLFEENGNEDEDQ